MALSWGTEGCRRCQRHPSPPCFLPPGLGCSTWSPARAESPTRRWTAVNPSDLSSSSVRSLCVRCAQVLVADENWCYTMCRCVVNGLSVAFTPWCWCCKDVSGSDALMASWWGGPGDIVYWWDTIISRWIEEKVYFSSFFFRKAMLISDRQRLFSPLNARKYLSCQWCVSRRLPQHSGSHVSLV